MLMSHSIEKLANLFSFAVPPRQIFKLAPDRSCDRFTGKPYSTATGLYYYYHRWYDPTIGP
jgi:hypothetical protein